MRSPTKYIVAALLCVTLVASSVAIWALFFRESEVILAPDYAPLETEANAQTIPGDNGDKIESDEGGGSVSLSYSNQVSIDLSDRKAQLMFANPGKSNQDMLIQITVQDQVLVQSGRLTPSHQVLYLDLLEDAADKLTPGGYDGKFQIFYYDPISGEKAVVNTEIPIKIIVRE